MDDRERLIRTCALALQQRGLTGDDRYKARLRKELKEIDQQGEHEYLLKLHDDFQKEGLVFPCNEHNTLVDWLLGLADEFDIDRGYDWTQGELPDADIDYIDVARDYLKNDWAPRVFGREKVCAVGTYGTLGIKSSILDMTGIHGVAKDEIQSITVQMEDKDDEGKALEWDSALRIYPRFKEYCEFDDTHRKIAAAARDLIDRNKSAGVHAGGLIISGVDIAGFVPLEVRSVKKEHPNGIICSAWTEGQGSQDLMPVGFVKFDLLVISNLKQIAYACKLVKERHGLSSIFALPGQRDWSDTSYLDDPEALALAAKGDTKCIFQFEGDGMRKLLKEGGVTRFDDLPAYSALFRPGPISGGLTVSYCKRKQGQEVYKLHHLLEPILGKTYGVMVYQEQIMDLLRIVGRIPDMYTEKIRKAISKKKLEAFIKWKEVFIRNGQEVLGVDKAFVEEIWRQIEVFSEYGFNKSHAVAYAFVSSRLLELKAHWPLEFYTAILMCEENDKKFKEYRQDAKRHKIRVRPININHSKENFAIHDGDIYFGFQNIKRIGEGVAKRIVEGQPYKGFVDFLTRFGTDLTPIRALIALGVFDEKYDRIYLRKFHEYFKKHIESHRDTVKRYEKTLQTRRDDLNTLLLSEITVNDPDFAVMNDFTPEAQAKWAERFSATERTIERKVKGEVRTKPTTLQAQLDEVYRKYIDAIEKHEGKERVFREHPLNIDRFDTSLVKLDPDEEKLLSNEIVVEDARGYPDAERMYYGFQWLHEIEASPDYEGFTIDRMLYAAEKAKELDEEGEEDAAHTTKEPWTGYIEVVIKESKERVSKSGKSTYRSLIVEDGNGHQMRVTVWMDDYLRFRKEMQEGVMCKMQVRPPTGGFETLTFKSYPKWAPKGKRRVIPPPKEEDVRLVLLRQPEVQKPQEPEDLTDLRITE